MNIINSAMFSKKERDIKVLQFGEGGFLRAFVDYMIDIMNEKGTFDGNIVLVKPIAFGSLDNFRKQDCNYTVLLRGLKDGAEYVEKRVITSVADVVDPYAEYGRYDDYAKLPSLRYIVSNTTEAGIVYDETDTFEACPPATYPGKLTKFLYTRYKAFDGAADKGLLFLADELIDHNGAELLRIVLQYASEWELEEDFISWVKNANHFTSTLVDRIVTGFPRDDIASFEERLGYKDNLLDTCEFYYMWAIEGDEKWADKLPVHKLHENAFWTKDVTPYKKRKVRILNGAHTATVLAAYLAGHDLVIDFMKDDVFKTFMNELIYDEVIPTLDLPKDDLLSFAASVNDRFMNPFIKHRLLDISLNSCSKFCARCLPSLLEYKEQSGKLPTHLVFSLAAFIRFYKVVKDGDGYVGTRENGQTYPVRDDAAVLSFFENVWADGTPETIAQSVLSNTAFWDGRDLTKVEGLCEAVAGCLAAMEEKPIREILSHLGQVL